MTDSRPTDETVAVELTPQGRGAVAVVVVAGPDATRIAAELFKPASGRPLAAAPIGRIVFGRWGGAAGEEVVVYRCDEDELEVHCHGGVAAVNSIISDLVPRGCRRLTWQEWVHRTATDPIRAAAQIALAEAPTARAAAILLDQYNGALSGAIHSIIEAALAGDWRRAAEILEAILGFRDVGQHLIVPWRVVLAGPPNVGKSSLINALAGFERAIVAATPGTTRDVVTTQTAIGGWPVELVDTAGLREAEDEIESAGVALAGKAVAAADLVLAVHDAGRGRESFATNDSPRWLNLPVAKDYRPRLRTTTRVIHIWNKIDLVNDHSAPHTDAVLTSAVTGKGIDALVRAIAKALMPVAAPNGAALPFLSSQLEALEAARIAITKQNAYEVRRALQALLPT